MKRNPGAPARQAFPKRFLLRFSLICLASSVAVAAQQPGADPTTRKPADIPAAWKPWIGDYGSGALTLTIGESSGELFLATDGVVSTLQEFPLEKRVKLVGKDGQQVFVEFHRNSNHEPRVIRNDLDWGKRDYGVDSNHIARVKLVKPIEEARQEAQRASPPAETGNFRTSDLVELVSLDPTLHLEIRYATTSDFLGAAVYTQARAFLQRPAAEALLRVQGKLKVLGYGLLIHDAYRPWYVTKIFWDVTPAEGKPFVADPAHGSRHNRGCAVDLTLYDLASGATIEMPGAYDEMSPRSFPAYIGGTSLQRWHRDLLRRAMESESFAVNENEWWHFDFKDWQQYPIQNIPFENLGATRR